MSLDDPKAWRSTLDKSTGHTYYYHKKTRVSQWVKPDCLVQEEAREREAELEFQLHEERSRELAACEQEQLSPQSNAPIQVNVDFASYAEPYDDEEGELDTDANTYAHGQAYLDAAEADYYMNKNEHEQYGDDDDYDNEYQKAAEAAEAAMRELMPNNSRSTKAKATVGSIVPQPKFRHELSASASNSDDDDNDDGVDHSRTSDGNGDSDALDPEAVTMISQITEQIRGGSPMQILEGLELLLSCCIPSTVDAISNEPNVINCISGAILSAKSSNQRSLGLKCLWCLATGTKAINQSFLNDQSWTGLGEQVQQWDDDIESLIIYSSMLGLLLGSRYARNLIDVERASYLSELVSELSQEEDLLMNLDLLIEHPATDGLSLLDPCILQAQACGTAGHPLSSAVVIALSSQCLKQSKHTISFLQCGGMSILQRVHSSPWVGVELRMYSRKLMLYMMECSSFVREGILDSVLSVSSSLGRIPIPDGGSDPLQRKSGFKGMTTDDDVSNEPGAVAEAAALAALSPQEQLENNFIGEAEFYEINEASSIPRDVIWRPRHGCGWKVSSVMLWTRCPALRLTIEDLWNTEDGGELELGTNTSSLALACVVRYLHSNSFVPLTDFYSSLELVKLALELGCTSLVTAASNAVLHALNMKTAETVQTFARNMGLPELEENTTRFINGDTSAKSNVTFVRIRNNENGNYNYNNNDADDYLAVMGMKGSAQEYDSNQNHHSPSGSKKQQSTSSRGSSKHPQSGGIYGLLLQGDGATDTVPTSTSNGHIPAAAARGTSVGETRGGNRAIPGKAPQNKANGSAAFGRGDTNKGKPNNSGKRGQAAPRYASEVLDPSQEYNSEMSLEKSVPPLLKEAAIGNANAVPTAAEKAKEAREKRLSSLSQPKEQTVKEKLAERKEAREKLLKRQKEIQEKKTAENANANQEKEKDEPKKRSSGGGGGGSIQLPTRASSPPTVLSTTRDIASEAPAIKTEVRRSLASLKNKALTKRRSVSDSQEKVELMLEDYPLADEDSRPITPATPPAAPVPVRPVSRGPVECTRRVGCMCSECSMFSNGSPPREIPLDSPIEERRVNNNNFSTIIISDKVEAEEDVNVDVDADVVAPSPQMPYVPTNHIDDEPLSLPAYDGDCDDKHSPMGYDDLDPLESSAESILESSWDESAAFPVGSPEELHECGQCGRKFRQAALDRHSKTCGKEKKRKPMDMSKHRLDSEAQELAASLARQHKRENSRQKQSNKLQQNSNVNSEGQPQWKKESEAFRDAMRNARETTVALKSGGPLPEYTPSGPDPSLIPCPHCGRRFNSNAAERHIPKCKDIRAKPSVLKAGSGKGIGTPVNSNSSSGFGQGKFNF
jgi:hypothetical protein